MEHDSELLASIPDFLSINTLMKAHASTEGGDRIVYFEASKESRDQHGEVILSKALRDSAGYFLKFGVVDIDHKSMPAVAKSYGIDRPEEWAIGQPVDVRFDGDTTWVKTKLYSGDTQLAERANNVWDGLTKLSPPARYYASVGGAVLGREVRIDPETKERVPVVTKVRWNNLAATLTPVHAGLDIASTAPVGVFAKALGGFVLSKGLEAGYGTDSATLTGGSALRQQSLDQGSQQRYIDFRDRLAHEISTGNFPTTNVQEMVREAGTRFGLSKTEASQFVERFLGDLKRGIKERK